MYSITELKKGTNIELEGKPYQVTDYQHTVLGRGGALVRVKVRSLLDGSTLSRTFRGSDKIAPASLHSVNVQYLYQDNQEAHFMDTASYEQITLPRVVVADQLGFMSEGMEVLLQSFNGRPIGIELPKKVALKVVSADPAVKGDSVSSVMKNCQAETGLTVQVPLFIKAGDTIRVDTRTGAYVERT